MGFAQDFDNISRAEASSAAARFIYNEVQDWRGSEGKPIAVKRWLWELLQNARDCANGRPFSFTVSWKSTELTVRHSAGPFKLKEIVALVEGDSSKQRRSVETTGRFGKGFLVTHVISTEVRVRGVLTDKERGRFAFTFQLSRGGSEGQIIQNIRKCAQALDGAHPVEDDSCETLFTYLLSPKDASRLYIEEALRELKTHSPYLFAFIPELTELTCAIDGQPEAVFTSMARTKMDVKPAPALAELVSIKTPAGQRSVLTLVRAFPQEQEADHATMAFELRKWPECPEISPPATLPISKLFQDLPLHATGDLEIPVVLNLPRSAEVDSDRAGPNLNDTKTRQAIEQALSLLPSVIEWARSKNFAGAFRLAEFGISEADRKNPDKERDWRQIIQPVLRGILSCQIVETSKNHFVRLEEAIFPSSSWLELETQDWDLLSGTRDLLQLRGDRVPVPDSLNDWECIVQKWRIFKDIAQPRLTGLKHLLNGIETAKSLAGLCNKHLTLSSEKGALEYVCKLFGVAADYCRRHGIIAPAGLAEASVVPNQSGVFRPATDLRLDRGIDELLKDISEELGMPFRERLVHPALASGSGGKFVSELCGNREVDTGASLAELMNAIESRASTSQKGGGADATKKAAVKLLVWLSTHPSHAGGHDLKPFPLLCEDGQLRTFADVHEAFLLPSQFLCEGEREWAKLLPDYVRLSEVYVQCCDSLKVDTTTLCQFLKGRRLASASLIFETTAAFSSELVAALQPVTTAGAGHRIDALNAKDVAGLTRLLSDTAGASASGDWLHAQSVFRFVLGWLVPNDNSWKATIRCQCSARQQHGCEGTVAVYPCQWLGKLKTNPWIPGGGSGGSCQTLNADTAKLLLGRVSAEIIESTEARKFLSMHCGVDALELAIRAAAGGDLEKEVELRGQWAQAVDLAQPSELVEFVNRRRSASEINTRNGALGRIVEELVKAAFRREGFDVERTGVGSDFRATIATGADPNWEREDVGNLPFEARLQGRVFNFLVEVKATKEDSVRMSWIQGDTAARNSDGYVLCVVDFGSEKGLYHQVLSEDEPTCGLIAKCIRVAPRIGEHLAGAVRNLSTAAASSEPGIEVEKADEIRFRILRQVWLTGEELGVWARTVRDQLISR